METKDIFRKKAVDRVNSPEQLNDYIRVTSPSIWMVLAGVICILAGAIVWGIFGNLYTTVDGAGIVYDRNLTVYIRTADRPNVEEGMTINCNGLILATPELTTLSLAFSYSDVDPEDVKTAIAAASLDAQVPPTPSVGDIQAETEGTDLAGKRDQTYDKAVVASVADFDAVWDAGMAEYLAAGGQAIIDERTAAWDATYSSDNLN